MFELAVGQYAVIVEENNPNQVLRTSKVVTICSISADCKTIVFRTEHGSEYELLLKAKEPPDGGSFFALRRFGCSLKQCSQRCTRFVERYPPQR